MPARDLKYSPIRCGAVPMPPDEKVDLARIGLGVGDQLLHGICRQRGMHHQDVRVAATIATGS